MEPKAQVGANIRIRRSDLNITQEEAAERCGIHPVEFARAERGVRDLRISTIAKIAHGLKTEASKLVADVTWPGDAA